MSSIKEVMKSFNDFSNEFMRLVKSSTLQGGALYFNAADKCAKSFDEGFQFHSFNDVLNNAYSENQWFSKKAFEHGDMLIIFPTIKHCHSPAYLSSLLAGLFSDRVEEKFEILVTDFFHKSELLPQDIKDSIKVFAKNIIVEMTDKNILKKAVVEDEDENLSEENYIFLLDYRLADLQESVVTNYIRSKYEDNFSFKFLGEPMIHLFHEAVLLSLKQIKNELWQEFKRSIMFVQNLIEPFEDHFEIKKQLLQLQIYKVNELSGFKIEDY